MSDYIIRLGHRSRDPMARMPRETNQDARLSYRARGVLWYLCNRDPGHPITREDLIEHGTEGEYAIRQALYELEKYGYARQTHTRNTRGEWSCWQWHVADYPAFISSSL